MALPRTCAHPACLRLALAQMLLQRLESDPHRAVRRAIAAVVCSVASHQLQDAEWPELLQFVELAAKHASADYRELGFMVLCGILEAVGIGWRDRLPSLKPLLEGGLRDSHEDVRIETLKSVNQVILLLENRDHLLAYKDLVGDILTVVAQCAENMNNGMLCDAFEALTEMAESELPLLKDHLVPTVRLVHSVLMNESLGVGARRAASVTLQTLISTRPRALANRGLIPDMVKALCDLATEHFTDPNLTSGRSGGVSGMRGQDEETAAAARSGGSADDDDDAQIVRLAAFTLDTMFLNMPVKKTWKALVPEAMARISSTEWAQRRAGLMALAVSTEGCRSEVASSLTDLLLLFIRSAQDSVPAVRETAFWAISQTAEYIPHSVGKYHKDLFPIIVQGMTDASSAVATKATFVLEMYAEAMDEAELRPYVTSSIDAIGVALRSGHALITEYALGALASICINAGESILPRLAEITGTLLPYMEATDKTLLGPKARAIDCMGYVLAAAGKASVVALLATNNFVPTVYAALQFDDPNVTEAVLAFFGQLASVMKEDFADSVHQLAAYCMDIIRSKTTARVTSRLQHTGLVSAEEDAHLSSLMGEEGAAGGSSNGKFSLHVHHAYVEASEQALVTLGQLAHNAPIAFSREVSHALPIVHNAASHYHDGLRVHSVPTWQYLLESAVLAEVATTGTVSAGVLEAVGTFLYVLMALLEEDDCKEVVARALGAARFMMELEPISKADILAKHADTLTQRLLLLLQGKAECQHPDDSDEEEDEGPEHDHILMDALMDCIAGMAKWLQGDFAPLFVDIHKELIGLCSTARPSADRRVALGCLAEVLDFMGPTHAAQFVPSTLPVAATATSADSYDVRQNAVFCVGTAMAALPSASADDVAQVLAVLLPHLTLRPQEEAGVVDNTVGALARIHTKHSHALSAGALLKHVYPALPLQHDRAENTPLYAALLAGLDRRDPDVVSALPQLLPVFAHDLAEDRFNEDETPATLAALLRALVGADEASMTSMLSALPGEQQAVLMAAIRGQPVSPSRSTGAPGTPGAATASPASHAGAAGAGSPLGVVSPPTLPH